MSIEIGLQHLTVSGSEPSPRPGMLQHLLQVARRVYAEAELDYETRLVQDGDGFTVELPDGTGEVQANVALFPLAHLDPLSVRMIFEIARAGDMAILGDGLVILTRVAQQRPSWASDDETQLCHSSEQLEQILSQWLSDYRGFRDATLTDISGSSDELEAIPGTLEDVPASFIYVEARRAEAVSKHQKALYKYYQEACRAGAPHRPSHGILMSEFWRLTTPEGRPFYAYRYGGDKANWLVMIREYARSEGRMTGWIENCDTFVQDDGRYFALVACDCTKVQE